MSCYWALIDGSVPEDQADIAGVGFRVSNEFEGDCPKRGDADELKHAVGGLVYSVEEDIVGFESIVVDGVVGDAGDGASQVSLIAQQEERYVLDSHREGHVGIRVHPVSPKTKFARCCGDAVLEAGRGVKDGKLAPFSVKGTGNDVDIAGLRALDVWGFWREGNAGEERGSLSGESVEIRVEEHAGTAMDDKADESVVELCRQQRRKVVEHSQQHLPRQLTMVVVGRVSHVYTV